VSEPEWFLPFVELPDWVRENLPADFQEQVQWYAAWRTSNDKTFEWAPFNGDPNLGNTADIREAAADQNLVPTVPVGGFTDEDRQKIQAALDAGQIKDAYGNEVHTFPTDTGRFPDFTGHVAVEVQLDPKDWNKSDKEQFEILNKQFGGHPPDGYTWHHHQQPGRMQLVEFGVHAATSHDGGRKIWALSPR